MSIAVGALSSADEIMELCTRAKLANHAKLIESTKKRSHLAADLTAKSVESCEYLVLSGGVSQRRASFCLRSPSKQLLRWWQAVHSKRTSCDLCSFITAGKCLETNISESTDSKDKFLVVQALLTQPRNDTRHFKITNWFLFKLFTLDPRTTRTIAGHR